MSYHFNVKLVTIPKLYTLPQKLRKQEHTSPKTEKTRAYVINSIMTALAHELSVAHTGLEKIAKVLGMHNMHLKAYQSHNRRVSDTEFEAGKDCLQLA